MMKMLIWYLVFLVIFQAGLVRASDRKSAVDPKQIEGVWVRQKYVAAVRATRSPFAEEPVSLTFSFQQKGCVVWTNFHEGSWREIVRIEKAQKENEYRFVLGQWEVESPKPEETMSVPFRIEKDQSGKISAIIFLDDDLVANPGERFVWLPMSLEQYINEMILAGTYKDQTGKLFSFDKAGVAHWPEQSFPYKVSLDASEAGCDYFRTDDAQEPGGQKRYGFKWTDGKLELFKIKVISSEDGPPISCEKQPFAVLTPQ